MKVHIYHSIEYAYEFDELAGCHTAISRVVRTFGPDPHRPLIGWDCRKHRYGKLSGPHETIEAPEGWRLGKWRGQTAMHHDDRPEAWYVAQAVSFLAANNLDGFRQVLAEQPLTLFDAPALAG